MNQVGEAEWNSIQEKERQQKLMEFKLQEKRLREEGKLEEANQLLKDLIDAEQGKDDVGIILLQEFRVSVSSTYFPETLASFSNSVFSEYQFQKTDTSLCVVYYVNCL